MERLFLNVVLSDDDDNNHLTTFSAHDRSLYGRGKKHAIDSEQEICLPRVILICQKKLSSSVKTLSFNVAHEAPFFFFSQKSNDSSVAGLEPEGQRAMERR